MESIVLNSPLDMHLHLRDEQMLKNIANFSAEQFSGGLIMPNLVPPVDDKNSLLSYKNRILEAVQNHIFNPYMSIFFSDKYTESFLSEIKNELLVVKLYPSGVTTNSESGVKSLNLDKIGETLNAMEKLNIPLAIHGETNGFVLDREKEFLEVYELLAKEFPKLKIIMEHLSSRESIELLEKYDNLFATITLHHMLITLDDLIGGSLNPFNFCKPVVKTPADREALRNIALNAHEKVMFGSDSAPHLKSNKLLNGSAGVFTAPVLLQGITQIFDEHDKLENLQKFISDNAQKIYNITPPEKKIKLIKKEFQVPSSYFSGTPDEIVPFLANQKLNWSII
jgi:dihydroorotase